jgi:hypothetical protein
LGRRYVDPSAWPELFLSRTADCGEASRYLDQPCDPRSSVYIDLCPALACLFKPRSRAERGLSRLSETGHGRRGRSRLENWSFDYLIERRDEFVALWVEFQRSFCCDRCRKRFHFVFNIRYDRHHGPPFLRGLGQTGDLIDYKNTLTISISYET